MGPLKKGFKASIGLIFGVRAIKQQKRYMQTDLAHLKKDFLEKSKFTNNKFLIDDWENFINQHHITTAQLKQQYRKRQYFAIFLLVAGIFLLYYLIVEGHVNVSVAGLLIIGLLYFHNNFRLYQIRCRHLCSITYFLNQARKNFHVFLPLNLPANWQVLDESAVQTSEHE